MPSSSLRSLPDFAQQALLQLQTPCSLHALVWLSFRLALQFSRLLLLQELRRRDSLPWPLCPRCYRFLHSKGLRPRTVLTLIGPLTFRRRVGRCPNRCEIHQVAPLDQVIGLRPAQRVSSELVEIAALLTVFVPYSCAARLLQKLYSQSFDPKTLWRWTQALGQRIRQYQDQGLDSSPSPSSAKQPRGLIRALWILAVDGVFAPFRPNTGSPKGKLEWREVKIGVLGRQLDLRTRTGAVKTKLTKRKVAASLKTCQFVDHLQQRLAWASRDSPGDQKAWISDGARGFWGLYESFFRADCPTAILDFYHASQYLHRVSVAVFGEAEEGKLWFRAQRHDLRHGHLHTVLWRLLRLEEREEVSEEALDLAVNCSKYLVRHQEHVAYPRLRFRGFPIGSGMVESACKWVIQQRFKGCGMRWSREGFENLLALRLLWANEEWEVSFKKV